ncbi:MAG: flagellar basal-body rod protein FlgG [Deltaproteobacteria bacterium]|nr:flagellar basal-body rod protein FlgG [Deltaproteobacteria bacterium]
MLRALSTAATGMEAQQSKLDVVANNLANVNTAGFRKSRTDFADLLYETIRAPGTAAAEGREVPVGVQIGHGTKLVATQMDLGQGQLKQTDNPLDMAIEGDGFFAVSTPDGRTAYTRAGTFKTDSQGQLTTADGNILDPAVSIPADATKVTIGKDGTISALLAGQTQPTQLGKIQLVTFPNPAGLSRVGGNLFLPSQASGEAKQGAPGTNGMGTIAQGFVELSNVKVVEEMIELIVGQRAYEANSRVVRAADEMLQATSRMG